MSDIVCALDPGAKGAIAWVSRDGHLIDVEDMPMSNIRGKPRVTAAGVALALRARPVRLVVIEGVGSMPDQGVASSFAFGYAAGLLEGVAAGLGLPVEIVFAAAWKRRAGVSKDKGAARQMASRFWPGAADKFKRVRDDGRAESALLARWAALRDGDPMRREPRARLFG
jgi:crossover junction endodeoxyribonuclease RuvC